MGQAERRVRDLTVDRFAAELSNDLYGLSHAHRSEGASLGLESSRSVHGRRPPEIEATGNEIQPARSFGEEPEILEREERRNGVAVVDFGDLYIEAGARRACANARRAASTVESNVVRSRRCWSAIESHATWLAAIRIGVSVYLRAVSSGPRTIAAAPSESGAQSKTPRGSATGPALTTCSSVILFR